MINVSSARASGATQSIATLPLIDGKVVSRDLQSSLLQGNGNTNTLVRATTATVIDHENILRTVLASEIAITGGRRVKNTIKSPSAGWTVQAEAVGIDDLGNEEYRFNLGTTDGRGIFVNGDTAFDTDHKIIISVELKSETIAGNVLISEPDGVILGINKTVSVSTEWTRFTTSGTVGSDGSFIGVYLRFNTAGLSSVLVRNPMTEDSTGQTDTTTPSEFVSLGVLSAPFHGANVDGVQWFPFDNGNSVASNVVTEARGTDLTGITGIQLEEQRINSALQSRDFSNASWAKTNITAAKDADGLDGLASGASSLTASAANGTCFQVVTIASAEQTVSFWVRRKTGTGDIDMTDNGGTNYTTITLTTTYQRFTLTRTQANPSIGFRIVVDTDAIEVDFSQLETGAFATSVVATTTVAVQRNKTKLTHPETGIRTNDLSGQFDWTPGAAGQGTVFLQASYVDASNYTAVLHDGTNIIARKRIGGTNTDATKALTYVAGTTYNIDWRFDSVSGIDIFVDGTKGTNHTNTTECQIGATFEIGSDGNNANQMAGEIKDFEIFNTPLTDAQIA